MVGLTALECAVGATKPSEYPEKPWRPEDRQYAELPSWDPADELRPLWCTEVGGSGCGRWTVLGCSDAAENQTFYLKSHIAKTRNIFAAVVVRQFQILCFQTAKALLKTDINPKYIWVCLVEPTLSYGSRRVGAVGQLIGLQA